MKPANLTFSYQTPHAPLLVTLGTSRDDVLHITFQQPHDSQYDTLPHCACNSWLNAFFSHQTLPTLPTLLTPRHSLEAAMRDYLWSIPTGTTKTYGELAKGIGSSPRGVGRMLAANPLPILIPCHRIIAKHNIGGFGGGFDGGIDWKRFLLEWERAYFEMVELD